MIKRCVSLSRPSRLKSLLHVFLDFAAAEDRIPRHQQLRSRSHHVRNCIQRHSAVHFNPEIQSSHVSRLHQRFHLAQRPANEFLPAETRVHRHHQHVMHNCQHFVQLSTGVAGLITTPG